MSFEVRLSAGAEAELDRILGGLSDHSTAAAEKLARQFAAAVERLREHPHSGGLAFENGSFPAELRHSFFWINPRRKYRALYFIEADTVQIVAIRAPGQGPIEPSFDE